MSSALLRARHYQALTPVLRRYYSDLPEEYAPYHMEKWPPNYPHSKEMEKKMKGVAPFDSRYYGKIPDDKPGWRPGPRKMLMSNPNSKLPAPPPAKIQWAPAKNDRDKGFIYYERYYGRDAAVAPPAGFDNETVRRGWVNTWKYYPELYPLFFVMGLAVFGCAGYMMICMFHSEIDMTGYKGLPSFHWERVGPDTKVGKPYFTRPVVLINANGLYNSRNEAQEILQKEMLEAARARGTL